MLCGAWNPCYLGRLREWQRGGIFPSLFLSSLFFGDCSPQSHNVLSFASPSPFCNSFCVVDGIGLKKRLTILASLAGWKPLSDPQHNWYLECTQEVICPKTHSWMVAHSVLCGPPRSQKIFVGRAPKDNHSIFRHQPLFFFTRPRKQI